MMANDTDPDSSSPDRIVGVREQAADRVRTAIASGDLLPGQRLPERELCILTGASRTTVREVVRQLETEGLITTTPHRGPTVALLEEREAREIYEFRAFLEGQAGRLFVERAKPDLVAALSQAVDDIGHAHDVSDMVGVIANSDRFYRILAEGVANRPLSQALQTIHNRLALFRFSSTRWPGRAAQSMAELHSIADAANARDAAAMERACIHHIEAAAEMALLVIAERARGAAAAQRGRRARSVAA
ncbi:GntR family transcriptional regulator [Terrarubrum flagellatum]|uniref:GntR family transcriptional regulator n=1 Tax=Terrirubrum flagellatum TaxID=2895980 RepID=UPI003144D837